MTEENGTDPWGTDPGETSEKLSETFVQNVSRHARAKTSILDLINLILVGFSTVVLSLVRKNTDRT